MTKIKEQKINGPPFLLQNLHLGTRCETPQSFTPSSWFEMVNLLTLKKKTYPLSPSPSLLFTSSFYSKVSALVASYCYASCTSYVSTEASIPIVLANT